MLRFVGIVLLRVSLHFLPRVQVRAFALYSQVGKKNLELFASVLGDALDLIHEQRPRQHAMVLRYVKRFILVPSGGDHFLEGISAHFVSWDWPTSRDPTGLALNIVHEAMHARLAARGCRLTEESIGRIETLCVNQEIILAETLPNAPTLVRKLRAALENPWWSVSQARARAETRLRSVGTPEYLIRIVLLLRFGRTRRHR